MKKSKLSDSQIFAMLNEAEAGISVNDICRKYSVANSTYYKTIDKSGANQAGIDAINATLLVYFMLGLFFHFIIVRQIKYLNNIVEQDHRFIKKITPRCADLNPMIALRQR